MLTLAYLASAPFVVGEAVHGGMSAAATAVLLGYWAAGSLVFLVLLLRGREGSKGSEGDPLLVFPQVLFAISSSAMTNALNPQWRGLALQMAFVLLVFDMQRLSERQIRIATHLAIASLALGLGWRLVDDAARVNLWLELIFILVAAVHLPLLSFLARAVRGIRVRQHQSKLDLRDALHRLAELSIRDGLTHAYNRRHALSLLELEASRQARGGGAYALALIDIDHFKQINDRFGHAVGDAVLRDLTRIAQAVSGPADAFARWGGEEFLWLMPLSDADEGSARLHTLRTRMATHDWAAHAKGLQPTLSAGLVVSRLSESAHAAVNRADRLLYQAKAQGRDRVTVEPPADVHA